MNSILGRGVLCHSYRKQRITFDADAAEAHTMFTFTYFQSNATCHVPLFSMRRLLLSKRRTDHTENKEAAAADRLSRIQLKGKKWELNDTQINFDEGGAACLTPSSSCSTSYRRGVSQDCRPPLTFNGSGSAHCLINLSQSMS